MFVVCVAKKSSGGDPTSIKLNKRNSYFSVKALIFKIRFKVTIKILDDSFDDITLVRALSNMRLI